MWDLYLGPERGDVRHTPPRRARPTSRDCRPRYVLTCEFDPLRDEGISYALRMLQAGVPVELHNFVGAFHGFDAFPSASSRAASAEQQAALSRALHKT